MLNSLHYLAFSDMGGITGSTNALKSIKDFGKELRYSCIEVNLKVSVRISIHLRLYHLFHVNAGTCLAGARRGKGERGR